MIKLVAFVLLVGLIHGSIFASAERKRECRYVEDLVFVGKTITGPEGGDMYLKKKCVWRFKSKPDGCTAKVTCVPEANNNGCVVLKDRFGLLQKKCRDEILQFPGDSGNYYYYYYYYYEDEELKPPFKLIYKRSAQYKCTVSCEGDTVTTPGPTTGSTTTAAPPPPPGNCRCGIKNSGIATQSDKPARIVGGHETDKFEYPWQVGLIDGLVTAPFCGGSIINDQYVVTAAHCVEGRNRVEVSILDHDITVSEPETIRLGATVIVHPNYNSDTSNNDVSLLKLDKKLTWSDKLRPVCLPSDASKTYAGEKAIISGWGVLSETSNSPDKLQEVTVPVISNSLCQQLNAEFDITAQMLCAGLIQGGKDSCYGDSGGPLVVPQGQNHYQVGVVSFGEGCARAKKPGVYARVTEMLQWIKDSTAGATTCPAN